MFVPSLSWLNEQFVCKWRCFFFQDPNRLLYSGHSMGGHGCLEYLLRPTIYIYIHSCMQKRLSKNGWSFVELIAQNEATTYI